MSAQSSAWKNARALGYQGFTIPYPKLLGLEVSIRAFRFKKKPCIYTTHPVGGVF